MCVSVCGLLFWVKETDEKEKTFLEQCSKRPRDGPVEQPEVLVISHQSPPVRRMKEMAALTAQSPHVSNSRCLI